MSQHDPGSRARWYGLFFISLGVAMIIVDATIVNVAVPTIIRDLGITSTDTQWVQESYTLVFAAFLLTFGRLSDRFGRRRLFVLGVVIFVLASLLAASAESAPALIGSRVLQGFGGAMILPTSLSIINAGFRGRERGIAFAVWGSTIGGTAALGPLLGGWLTTSYSWRWAFGINVPIGIAVVVGTLLFVRESKDSRAGAGVDLLGALLSVVGFAAIVFGVVEGRNYGWWSLLDTFSFVGREWTWNRSPVPVAIVVGIVALALFAVVEVGRNRRGQPVLLDLGLFRITSFRNGNIAAGIVSLGEFGLLFTLPLWFQNVLGYSAFETGLCLLPLAIGSFAASGFGAVLVNRRGPLFVVRLGILLELVGVAGIGLVVSPGAAWWVTIPFVFLYGIGVGMATAQLTGVVLADVPVEQSGQGSGTTSTSRQIGAALGIAVLGTILFTSLGAVLDSKLAQNPGVSAQQREEVVNAVTASAGAIIPELASQPATAAIASDAKVAFTDATRYAAFSAAGFLIIGFAASLSLGVSRRYEDEVDPQQTSGAAASAG
jgi:EmrB/QacA subfamily drug resistance transporter